MERPGDREPPELARCSPTRSRSGPTTPQSSPFFGNVYVCYAAFRGNGNGFTNQPLDVLTSRDGGESWTQQQVTPATNNTTSRNGFGRSGCTVRTDSRGVVYVFDFQFGFSPTTAAPGRSR